MHLLILITLTKTFTLSTPALSSENVQHRITTFGFTFKSMKARDREKTVFCFKSYCSIV